VNSADRVRTALQRGQPDRVPVVEFLIDPAVYRAILPDAQDQADLWTGWTWTRWRAARTGFA